MVPFGMVVLADFGMLVICEAAFEELESPDSGPDSEKDEADVGR